MIMSYCPDGCVQDNDNAAEALLTLLVRLKLAASNIKPHQVPLPPHSNRQLTSVNEIYKGMDWQSIFKLQFSDLW